MILPDHILKKILHSIIKTDADETLVNPASIDIRIGETAIFETHLGWLEINLKEKGPITVEPNQFVLVSTLETIAVPNGYAIDLRLKSSRAREGWDHSHAFWVDPGWDGVLTMEIQNNLRYHSLVLHYGMRFAQIIVHQLDGPAVKPYQGKYNSATSVERAKP